jgi:dTDP-4-amino-4,6-dideoxygalactose transaminase
MHIPLIKPDLPTLEDIRGPLEEILGNGRITNFGKYMKQFETEAGEYLGAETVAVSSGTMGLIFTLSALGLEPGQKVILPSFTFMATAQAVLYAGGVPVFAEIDDDLNLSLTDLEKLLAEQDNVGAVIAVHMYGLPAWADKIEAIVAAASQKLGRPIPLIFDAAHAFGSAIGDRKVGTFGDAEIFSLSVTKSLVTVEGGLISSLRPELLERIRCMRNYGVLSNYNAHFPGLNGKMSEMHAIVGLHNLRRVASLIQVRQERARTYRDKVEGATGFRVTAWPAGIQHTFKDFTVFLPESIHEDRRPAIIQALADRGIETRAYFYPPVHEQAYFARFATRPLPKTERLSRRVVTLPFYSSLTNEEMDYVSSALVDIEQGESKERAA